MNKDLFASNTLITIRANNLKKCFRMGQHDLEVLKGIDITVPGGELLAIVGASGAGKSTLLHILGLLDVPNEGEIFFNDENMRILSNRDLGRVRNHLVGFVFQFHHLLPEFTALENVMMPALIARIPTSVAQKKAESLLDMVGLMPRAGHKPAEVSGGEQQRIALARALIMNPRMLLLDEPTGNLDSNTGEQISDHIIRLNQELKLTTILVTHNEKLAARMSRIVELADGKILETKYQ
jgi:lipoprotein-releasing system ATP-binding protein